MAARGVAAHGWATVRYNASAGFTLHRDTRDEAGGVAIGRFEDRVNSTGWSFLWLRTYARHTDAQQLHAAGLLEGALTAEMLGTHYRNWYSRAFKDQLEPGDPAGGGVSAAVESLLSAQLQWLRGAARRHRGKSAYWEHVQLVLAQFDGLLDGYNRAAKPEARLTASALLLLNAAAELRPITRSLRGGDAPFAESAVAGGTRGRALVALLRANASVAAQLAVAHASLQPYAHMLRVWKCVRTSLRAPGTAAQAVSSPSQPGVVFSPDAFAATDTGLVLLSNPLPLPQRAAARVRTSRAVPGWVRAAVATRLARDGAHWCEVFARHNGGTLPRQWLVVDLHRWYASGRWAPAVRMGATVEGDDDDGVAGVDDADAGANDAPSARNGTRLDVGLVNSSGGGVLWLLEQVPGESDYADATGLLRTSGAVAAVGAARFRHTSRLLAPDLADAAGPSAAAYARAAVKTLRRIAENATDAQSLAREFHSSGAARDLEIASAAGINATGGALARAAAPRLDMLPRGHVARDYLGAIDAKVLSFGARPADARGRAISGPSAAWADVPPVAPVARSNGTREPIPGVEDVDVGDFGDKTADEPTAGPPTFDWRLVPAASAVLSAEHAGQPDRWDFGWQDISPLLPPLQRAPIATDAPPESEPAPRRRHHRHAKAARGRPGRAPPPSGLVPPDHLFDATPA